MGAFITPISWIALLAALCVPSNVAAPASNAALQSPWLALHVPVMFAAYAAFANAFGLGLAYVIQERQIKSHKPSHLVFALPSLDDLDTLIYRVIRTALPILTLGLVVGAVWAHEAWGRFWTWDAKETGALVTWIVYALYLGARWISGWRGRKATYLSLAGFGILLVTYVGVNTFSQFHGFLAGWKR
jgi:cytochrome c-type biogenesis protein CcsB